MTTTKSEGIILQALTFKEADQILTVITPDGLIKLIYKGGLSKRRGGGSLTAPLQQAEFVYVKHKSELASCKEISIINPFAYLRQKLEFLESAGEMAAALITSQQTYAPNPNIYRLFLHYLENIRSVNDPFTLAASFKLKLLWHEGILALTPGCTICGTELKNTFIHSGQCYCLPHAPIGAIEFSEEESNHLMVFTYTRSMKVMAAMTANKPLLEKIRHLFHESLS